MNYAESQGTMSINWWSRLDQLEEISKIPPHELTDTQQALIDESCMAAGIWATCAVGNQCSIIKRLWSDGQPCDETLRGLGQDFSDAVDRLAIDYARYSLKAIEARVAKILPDEVDRLAKKLYNVGRADDLVRLFRGKFNKGSVYEDFQTDGLVATGSCEITDGGRLVAMELIERGLVSPSDYDMILV